MIGGAVMCLVYNARPSTKDIDGIFEPTKIIRNLVRQISEEKNISPDWLNDAAKGYITKNFDRVGILNLSNLRVWAPESRYTLAMKCLSARWDSHDKTDVMFLVKHLKMKSAKEVFKIIEAFFPKKQIPLKTQFLIEELFS
jgi:hypothetical protein